MKIEIELTEEIEEKMRESGKDFKEFGVHGGHNDGEIVVGNDIVKYRTCGGHTYIITDEVLAFEGPRQSLKSGSRFVEIYFSTRGTNVILSHGKKYSEGRQKTVFEGLDYTLYTRNPLTLPFYFPSSGLTGYEVGMTDEQQERYIELMRNKDDDEHPMELFAYEVRDDEFRFDESKNEIRNDNIVYTG